MPKFFVDSAPEGDVFSLSGEDAQHIGYSLRMKTGDELIVCCNGIDYSCAIMSITKTSVELSVLKKGVCAAEPNVSLTLYQALPKNDKLEHIIQKAVELGAARVVPMLTQRCVSRPTLQDFEKKRARLQKISESAAKQSGRGIIPEIAPLMSFGQVLDELKSFDDALIFYERGGKRMNQLELHENSSIAVLIGSEGGFSPSEAEAAVSAGCKEAWLGERILRCETAPTVALSLIFFLTNNI